MENSKWLNRGFEFESIEKRKIMWIKFIREIKQYDWVVFLCLILDSTKEKTIKENDFLMFDFIMKNIRENEI